MPKLSGSRLFAEMMRDASVSHIFFVPELMLKAFAEMEGMPIRRVMVHGEKAAAYMADGYARASGKPGVCAAQAIGASNLAAGLRDAWMAGSPVIAITGGPAPQGRYRHSYQEVEDFSQFDCVTKFNARVEAVNRLPDLLRQAFRAATSGAPGPVHLELQNRLGQVIEHDADMNPLVEARYTRAPAFRPEPDAGSIAEAAALLQSARRPILLAGGGVIRAGAEREVVELAEKLGIPVITSLNAKAAIVDQHPLSVGVCGSYSRDCANRAMLETDLVFFIGSHAGGQVTHNWMFPPAGTAVIQLDINAQELGRNYPNAVSILADARVGLRRLIDAVPARPAAATATWRERIRLLVQEWRTEQEPLRRSDAVPLRPERLCREISEYLPPDGIVVADTGHAGIWTATMIDFKHPAQRYFRCAGSLGWAFPAALGVKCALPDAPVVCFTGDGGFYYHIAELETAARHDINLVVVVNNNSALNQNIHSNAAAYGDKPLGNYSELWQFRDVNFAGIAENFGCVGIRVDTPQELQAALKSAFGMKRPVVLDVRTDVNAVAKKAFVAP